MGQPVLHEARARRVERSSPGRRHRRTCRGCPCSPQAGLLEPVGDRFTGLGVTQDKFTPAAWKKATVDGTTYAVPLDTHPFVLFYNVDAREEGRSAQRRRRRPQAHAGCDDFVNAIKAMKDAAGGDFGAVCIGHRGPVDLLAVLLHGLLRPRRARSCTTRAPRSPIDRQRDGGDVRVPAEPHRREKLMPSNATAITSSTPVQPGQGRLPLRRRVADPDLPRREVNGASTSTSYRSRPLLGDKPVAYADSHSLIVPHSSGRSDAAHRRRGATSSRGCWTRARSGPHGGHVPAWLPVQKSAAFQKHEAAEQLHRRRRSTRSTTRSAWYTGAGSDFQTAMGSVIASVLGGTTNPKDGVDAMTASLKTFSTARPPVELGVRD